MTPEQRIYDGNRAREVLENEAFVSAFATIEQEIVEQWTSSPARDEDGRQSLWQFLQMLRKVKATLTSTLETGKLATLQLQHDNRMQDMRTQEWDGPSLRRA